MLDRRTKYVRVEELLKGFKTINKEKRIERISKNITTKVLDKYEAHVAKYPQEIKLVERLLLNW